MYSVFLFFTTEITEKPRNLDKNTNYEFNAKNAEVQRAQRKADDKDGLSSSRLTSSKQELATPAA